MKSKYIKYIILSTVLCIVTISSTIKAGNASPKDSLLSIADTINDRGAKVDFLIASCKKNLNEDWTLLLIDYAMTESEALKDTLRQMNVLFEYARYFLFRDDLAKQYKNFENVREKSYAYRHFDVYFKLWYSLLQQSVVQSDLEYALLQAEVMEEEALKTENRRGVASAQLIKAQVYSSKKEWEKSAETYGILIDSGSMSILESMRMRHKLSGIYVRMEAYENAIYQMQKTDSMLQVVREKYPAFNVRYNNFLLEHEMAYLRIFLATKDVNQIKAHLDKASIYLSPNNFHSQVMYYYSALGRYFLLIGEYHEAEVAFHKALHATEKVNLAYSLFIKGFLVNTYKEQGRTSESIALLKRLVFTRDSLNTEILQRHEEVLQSNYNIQKQLLRIQKQQLYKYIIVACLSFLFCLVIVFFVIRSWKIRQQLRKADAETRKALKIVEEMDLEKENFLRTITFEVRISLNTVVGFVDLLSHEDEINTAEMAEYSLLINESASGLLGLINQVLDISRMEAGMMKFEKQEYNIVGLCDDAVMMAQMQDVQCPSIQLDKKVDTFMRVTDQKWFLSTLKSLLVSNGEKGLPAIIVEIQETQERLCITIKNSPLYIRTDNQQHLRLQHLLNADTMKQLGYTYEVLYQCNNKSVRIECGK